jgi:hypothetical protein
MMATSIASQAAVNMAGLISCFSALQRISSVEGGTSDQRSGGDAHSPNVVLFAGATIEVMRSWKFAASTSDDGGD